MANFYMVIEIRVDKNENVFVRRTNPEPDFGYYAYLEKYTEGEDLKFDLNCIGGLLSAKMFQTKKKASEAVARLNDSYKEMGVYLYDSPAT